MVGSHTYPCSTVIVIGGVTFAFEEEEHPRGHGGKFIEKGGTDVAEPGTVMVDLRQPFDQSPIVEHAQIKSEIADRFPRAQVKVDDNANLSRTELNGVLNGFDRVLGQYPNVANDLSDIRIGRAGMFAGGVTRSTATGFEVVVDPWVARSTAVSVVTDEERDSSSVRTAMSEIAEQKLGNGNVMAAGLQAVTIHEMFHVVDAHMVIEQHLNDTPRGSMLPSKVFPPLFAGEATFSDYPRATRADHYRGRPSDYGLSRGASTGSKGEFYAESMTMHTLGYRDREPEKMDEILAHTRERTQMEFRYDSHGRARRQTLAAATEPTVRIRSGVVLSDDRHMLDGDSAATHHMRHTTEQLTAAGWDEEAHPRGGDPEHPGRFSPKDGDGEKTKADEIRQAEDQIRAVIAPNPVIVSLTGADPALVTEVAHRIDVFAREFPDIATERIRGIAVVEAGVPLSIAGGDVLPVGAMAANAWNDERQYTILVLNRAYFEDADKFQQVVTTAGEPKRIDIFDISSPLGLPTLVRGDTAGIIDHELGHVLDRTQGTVDKHPDIWTNPPGISLYAFSGPREAFAEAFALRQAKGAGAIDDDDARHSLQDTIQLEGGKLTDRDLERIAAALAASANTDHWTISCPDYNPDYQPPQTPPQPAHKPQPNGHAAHTTSATTIVFDFDEEAHPRGEGGRFIRKDETSTEPDQTSTESRMSRDADRERIAALFGGSDTNEPDRYRTFDDVPIPPDYHQRLGRCYELAAQYVMANPGSTLVHGTIQGMGMPPLEHGWAIREDGMVHDAVLNCTFHPGDFEQLFNPKIRVMYDDTQARVTMLKYRHYGPWDRPEDQVAA